MDSVVIHNRLFNELVNRGSPQTIANIRIKYYPWFNQVDLLGFEGKTELKIKVMWALWRKIKKEK